MNATSPTEKTIAAIIGIAAGWLLSKYECSRKIGNITTNLPETTPIPTPVKISPPIQQPVVANVQPTRSQAIGQLQNIESKPVTLDTPIYSISCTPDKV